MYVILTDEFLFLNNMANKQKDKKNNVNDFVHNAIDMYERYSTLCEQVDYLLHSQHVPNTQIADALGISRLSVGRKRRSNSWKPEELKGIAEYLQKLST